MKSMPDLEKVTALIKQEIADMAKKFVKQYGIQAPPVDTLRGALELRSLTNLRELTKSYKMRGVSKKSKPELISAIADEVLLAERMEEFLYLENDEIYKDFLELMKAGHNKDIFSSVLNLDYLILTGYVQCFLFEDTISIVVPEEVKTLYSGIAQSDYPERRQRIRLLNEYAMAAVSLYGAIKQQELVDIFNLQNEDKTDIDELFPSLIRFSTTGHGYCFYDEYIAEDSFEEDDFEDLFEFMDAASAHPRYLPEKEEFLKYADYDYYEQTPQVLALKNYIGKVCPGCEKDPLIADDLVDEIVYLCRDGGEPEDFDALLDDYDLEFKSEKQRRQFFSLVLDVLNNVRCWVNNGHTRQELLQYEKTNSDPKPEKPGRNDPCSCGSGKKYKKCCGAN